MIVIDDRGKFVIPILSGHIGGANEIAKKTAEMLSAVPVITTATDGAGKFSCNTWAFTHGCAISSLKTAKDVSAAILENDIPVSSEYPLHDPLPEGLYRGDAGEIGIYIGIKKSGPYIKTLRLIPRVLSVGIGCRKGAASEALEHIFDRFCKERNILPQAIRAAASVSLKAEEEGLLRFCERHDWPIHFFEVEELISAEGDYSASAFVKAAVGVDNVCERAAVLESGGILIERKFARDGVTFALAEQKTRFDWSW